MHRTRTKLSLFALTFSLSLAAAGCAEEPVTDEATAQLDEAVEDSDEAVPAADELAEFDRFDDVDTGPVFQPDLDQDLVDNEPAGGFALPGRFIPGFMNVTGNYTGGDVTALSAAQPSTVEVAAKVAAATAQDAANHAGSAEFSVAAATCPKPKRILNLTHYAQQKGYYCGPASGYMMIRYLHGASFRSRKNNAALSQDNLATNVHMKTNTNHGTPWLEKTFVRGVNLWRGVNYYVQVPKPSAAVMRGSLTMTIGTSGMPMAADTVELAGGVHYNGHPVNRTIGHWIVGYGYESCGAKVYFKDPSTSVFPAAKAKFSYSSTTFASRFLQNNGIVY